MTDPQLPHALRILARDIHCEDGIATQCIREAADEIERLRLAIRRLAEQDATLSVCDGNVTVTMDATLTDVEREAVEQAVAFMQGCGWSASTLRGLLERCSQFAKREPDRPKPIATPEPQSTPAECRWPPEWTSRPYYVDPPSGHRYGFPRLYDPASDGDMTEWLIANGYPERLARQGLACTFTAQTGGT